VGERLLTWPGSGRERSGETGFTLVEVMMSMVITMTVLLAILGMFNASFRIFAQNKRLTSATNLAYSKTADFKAMTIAQIQDQVPKNDTRTVNDVQYARAWTVSNIDIDDPPDGVDDLVGDIVKIDLTVTWVHGGQNYDISMSSLTTGRTQ
jgi:type II secretory pathway pseudopilin PulG